MKTQMIMLAAVAAVVFAMAPAAQAAISYTENFVDASIGHDQPLGNSSTGWTGSGAWGDPYVGPHVHPVGGGYANTPDGDNYYVQNHTGQSSSKYAVSKPGEYTIPAAERTGSTVFTTDAAAGTTLGMKILANVGGEWYGSETFGTNDATNGAMDSNGVTEWMVDVSVNADTDNWYQAMPGKGLPDSYDWRDGNQWNPVPVVGLPAGDITQFGVGFKHTGNGHYGAIDNFRVTGGAAPPPPAEPTLVSVNLDRQTVQDPDQNTDRIPAASVIGVLPAGNWNNVGINTPGGPFSGLVDSNGVPVAGLSFTTTGGGSDSWNTGGHIPARMMGDWMNNLTGFDITLPENNGVTLITYHGGFNNGDDSPPENTVDVTANGVTKRYADYNWDNQQFDNASQWAYTEGENYLRWDFAGPTPSISATFQSVQANHRALNGFQLSITPLRPDGDIPEPATMCALGLAVAGLGGYVRRRRTA